MIFADTGYFVALANPRDSLHRRANAWANVLSEPLITTEFVLVEFANALSAPINRARFHATLDYLRHAYHCEIILSSSHLLEVGLQLHRNRPDKEWSLTDCISFVVMQERSLTGALAYDHHFEQAGFDPLLRRDPI